MIKTLIIQSYISLFSFLIGVIAIIILLNQFGVLGIEILSVDNRQPSDYIKREYNLLMLLLFGTVGIGGIGYGIKGIHKVIMLFRDEDTSNTQK